MALTRLQEDLLQEFKEERRMINGQIELFDPLADSMRRPVAQRLLNKSLLVVLELLIWLALFGTIILALFLKKLYPFYVLSQVKAKATESGIGRYNADALYWGIIGIIGVCAVLWLIIARMIRRIRQKNDILHLAGSRIKTLVGQHLQRKAAIDAIEQRHFAEIPGDGKRDVNTVENPGY